MKSRAARVTQLYGKFEGKDIFVVGTGSSLLGFNWMKLSGATCIALNDAIKVSEYFIPDVHLFADVGIWVRYRDLFYREFQFLVCQENARKNFEHYAGFKHKHIIRTFDSYSSPTEVQDKDDALFVNRTVATGGIMLAWKMGARRIFLMGVDGYKLRVSDETGKHEIYYCDGSTKPPEKRPESAHGEKVTQDRHEAWQRNMKDLREYFKKKRVYQEKWPGSGIFNLSPASTIDAWEKVKIESVLGEGCYPEGMRLPKE